MKRTCFIAVLALVLATQVSAHAFTAHNHPSAANGIIVKFKHGISEQKKNAVLKSHGAIDVQNSHGNFFKLVKIPGDLTDLVISLLKKHPAIKYVEPNHVINAYGFPNDEYYSLQWNLTMINLEKAWDISTGENVVVAVLDTGVNPDGKDGFGDRLLSGYNAFINTPALWEDGNYHGTHVAGTIGQETNNKTGVAGVAYNAEILPIKVLSRFRVGSVASVCNGIYWAADNDADIINMSLGGPEYSDIFEEAVNYAYSRGITIIAASGNENSEVGYPAAFTNVVAVGAIGTNKERAFYSNYGFELDIVAPGGDRYQDAANGEIVQETFVEFLGFKNRAFGWDYSPLSGTSMAAPHVAGVAALIKSVYPELEPDEIKEAIINTATDLGAAGKDNNFGYGLIDAYAAVTYHALP